MTITDQDQKADHLPAAVLSPEQRQQDGLQRAKSNSATSADLETAITKSGCGKFNVGLLLMALPASWTIVFSTGSMSFVLPAASAHLQLTPLAKALLQSAPYTGMICSGFFWGFLSDALGRKKLLILGYFLDSLMALLTGIFPVLHLMLLFKFLSGFMICGPYSIFTTYIAEVFLQERRDLAVLSTGTYSAIGNIIQAVLALLIIPAEMPEQIPFKSWQVFQMVCSIPSFLSGFCCLFCVESPKFLADKGDKEGALKVCQTIYTINTGNLSDTYPIKRLNHQPRKREESRLKQLLEGAAIFRPPFIQKASIIFIMHLGIVASQNALRLWLPEILSIVKSSELEADLGLCTLLSAGRSAGHNSTLQSSQTTVSERSEVYVDMIYVFLGCVVGNTFTSFLVKYIGKKKMLMSCAIIFGACSLALPLINADYTFVLASIFISFCNSAIFCNINVVVELFPTRMRATSVSLLMLIARTGILTVNFLIVNTIYVYCTYFFYGLAAVALIIAIMTVFIPEEPIDDIPETVTN